MLTISTRFVTLVLLPVFVSALLLLAGCSGGKTLTPKITKYTGATYGGIIEDTEVDAISSATYPRIGTGVRGEFQLANQTFETGIGWNWLAQEFEYNDPAAGFVGTRTLGYHQLRVPLTWNIPLFKDARGRAPLIFKLGVSGGATLGACIRNSSNLPNYDFTTLDAGLQAGMAVFPFQWNRKKDIGMLIEFYRGTSIFEDAYIDAPDYGNNSMILIGLAIREW